MSTIVTLANSLNTMHPFSDKLYELNTLPLKEFIEFGFKDLTKQQQKYLLEYVFIKLGLAFGGFSQFWHDAEEMQFIKHGWLDSWLDLTVKEILAGLYSILKCQTQYVTKPPRAPIEFYHICKKARPMPDKTAEIHDTLVAQENQDVLAKKVLARLHLAKIKAMLPKAYRNIKD
jgi:hypothetical protein